MIVPAPRRNRRNARAKERAWSEGIGKPKGASILKKRFYYKTAVLIQSSLPTLLSFSEEQKIPFLFFQVARTILTIIRKIADIP